MPRGTAAVSVLCTPYNHAPVYSVFSSLIVGFDQYLLPTTCTGCLRSALFAFYMCTCFLRSVLVAFVLYWFPSFGTGCLRSVLVVLISPSCCFADEGFTRNILIPGFSLLLSVG